MTTTVTFHLQVFIVILQEKFILREAINSLVYFVHSYKTKILNYHSLNKSIYNNNLTHLKRADQMFG